MSDICLLRRLSPVLFLGPVIFVVSLLGVARAEPAAKPTLETALDGARSSLVLRDGGFSEPGARILAKAVAEARFVLIGEDHFSREIPKFTVALCNIMKPDAYAVEAGPQAAKFVTGLLGHPDRMTRLGARMKAYPNNMAFLDGREENDTAAQCAQASSNKAFAVWGLDQEFLGAAGVLLEAMHKANPGPKSLAAIASLQTKEQTADKKARQSGDPGEALMISASAEDLQPLSHALAIDGNVTTRALFNELAESNKIYRLNTEGSADSNRVRAELFKQHFLTDYEPLKKINPDARVLFKFGDNHSGKGFSPLHVLDIGNFVVEMADAEQARTLHILVLGVRGEHGAFVGYAKPIGKEAFAMAEYPEYQWLTPALERVLTQPSGNSGTQLTLFDLRALRFRGIDLPPEWSRIVYSYDLFVLIPELSAASTVAD